MEPILDDEIRASIALAKNFHGPDSHDYDKRFHATLIYGGLKSEAEAHDIRKALYRSASYLGHSLQHKIEKTMSGYQVRYTVVCKECARAYIQVKYPDPDKRPYNPRRPRNADDHV